MMGRGKGAIAETLLKHKTSPLYPHRHKVREAISEFSLTERWGWTPEYIRSMDEKDRMQYNSILSGVSKGEYEVMENLKGK